MLWHTGFSSDHLLPAMREAGWPLKHWTETRVVWDDAARAYRVVVRQRTRAVKPWHSLRHRFARTMIDVYGMGAGELMAVGGWENMETVETHYYHSGQEHVDSAAAKVAAGPRDVVAGRSPATAAGSSSIGARR